MVKRKFTLLLVLSITGAILTSGCANMTSLFRGSPKPDIDLTKPKPKIVTGLQFRETCPVSKKSGKKFIGAAAVALAVIPPLIEKGLNGLGEAIKKAGAEKTYTAEANQAIDFYSLDPQSNSLIANKKITCLIVYRAEINGEKEDANKNISPNWKSFSESKIFKSASKGLSKDFGINSEPKFYFEATFSLSNDKTAFQLIPRIIFYGDEIGPHTGAESLVLNVGFEIPSSSKDKNTFAHYTTVVRRGEGKFFVGNPHLLKTYRSKLMTLPAASTTANESLTIYKQQVTSLRDFESQLALLDKSEDPKIVALSTNLAVSKSQLSALKAKIASQVTQARISLEDAIEICRKNLQCDIKNDKEIISLTTQIRLMEKNNVLKKEAMALEKTITDIDQAIKVKRAALTKNQQRKNLTSAIKKIKKNIQDSLKKLENSTPTNVTATLSETKDANKFLIALGDFLTSNAETAKNVATKGLTPKDKEAELQKNVDALTKLNTVQTTAITSVSAWSLAKNTYEGSGNDASRLAELRIAYFKAKLDCDIVESHQIIEPSCLALVEPPSP